MRYDERSNTGTCALPSSCDHGPAYCSRAATSGKVQTVARPMLRLSISPMRKPRYLELEYLLTCTAGVSLGVSVVPLYSVCRPQQTTTDVALLRGRMRKCRVISCRFCFGAAFCATYSPQTSTYLFAIMSERVLLVQWTADFEAPGPNDLGGSGGNASTGGAGSGNSERYGYRRHHDSSKRFLRRCKLSRG